MLNFNISSQYTLPVSILIVKIARFTAVFYFMGIVAPEDFSKWILINLILQYSLFLQLGFPGPTSRELSIAYGKHDLKAVSRITILSLQVFLIASIVFYLLLDFFYLKENFTHVFWYVTISHASALLVMQARATFQNYKVIISQCIECLIIFIGLFYLNSSNPLESLINIYLVAGFLSCIILFPKIRITLLALKIYSAFGKEALKMLKYSWPILLFTLFMLFKSTWDILLVNYFEIENSSSYISSNILGDCIRIIISLLSMVFLPYMAKKYGEASESISAELIAELKRYQSVSLLAFVFIAVALYPILYYGSNYYYTEYMNSIDIFFIRTIAVLFGILSVPNLLFLSTIRLPNISNLIVISSILIGLLLTIFLKDVFGIFYTMPLSILISNLICYILSNVYIRNLKEKQLTK